MATISFKDLSFGINNGSVRFQFLKNFYFDVKKEALEKIGAFTISGSSINFKEVSEKRARNKLNVVIEKGLNNLHSSVSGKRTVYIHSGSGIPLIGSIDFGLIDRNTSLIEVRPVTGCNINCVFCSVNEGLSSPKTADYAVEKDYLVQEFRKLAEFKNCSVEAHINAQGEPLVYGPIAELVKDLAAVEQVKVISMDTNATLLDKKFVDELVEAGLTRFNVSLNAVEEKTAKKVCGTAHYDVKKIMETIEYISTKECELLLAPILVPGFNDDEIPKIIKLGKKLNARVGVQNFLNYPHGRNPAKQTGWKEFYEKLKGWETEFGMKLTLSAEDFSIVKTKKLPNPFRKGEIIEANVVCEGRKPGEMVAVAGDRTVKIVGCSRKGRVKAKILRTKHNIFMAKCLK